MTSTPPSQPRDLLVAEADAAAAKRDFPKALRLLEEAKRSGLDDLKTALKRASLYRATGALPLALASVDEALAFEPLDLVALLLRASLLEQLGSPEAGEAYGRALVQREGREIPPSLQPTIDRAEQVYQAHVSALSDRLEGAARSPDLTSSEQRRAKRFATNIARKTRHYHSEPTDFHFPELPEVEFPSRDLFPWMSALEAVSGEIAKDLATVMAAERAELVPYVQYDDSIPMRQWKDLNRSLDWTAIHLLLRGKRVEANARHCPNTMAALSHIPQPDIDGYTPNAMFSLLAPGTHIPPHHGVANVRLVCHLPLIVPADCWFRCGAERRGWNVGEAFVFDDTIEHEAANESDALRVVLIADVWNPFLSEAEEGAVRRTMLASGHHGFEGL